MQCYTDPPGEDQVGLVRNCSKVPKEEFCIKAIFTDSPDVIYRGCQTRYHHPNPDFIVNECGKVQVCNLFKTFFEKLGVYNGF